MAERVVGAEDLDLGLSRLRVIPASAVETMRRSIERKGQLSPVVVAEGEQRLELIDGFKRQAAVVALKQATLRRTRANDRVGVISFARQSRLEYPAGNVDKVNVRNVGTGLDRNFTDIAAAVRLALASFPEGGARRILLISDGNENRGDAVTEARTAQLNGVPIDVVPLKYEYQDEVLVDRIDAPTEAQDGKPSLDFGSAIVALGALQFALLALLALRSLGEFSHELAMFAEYLADVTVEASGIPTWRKPRMQIKHVCRQR